MAIEDLLFKVVLCMKQRMSFNVPAESQSGKAFVLRVRAPLKVVVKLRFLLQITQGSIASKVLAPGCLLLLAGLDCFPCMHDIVCMHGCIPECRL